MTKVAIVYHSGYGHTAVLADKIAEGVRDAGQTPVVLKIDSAAQDFAPIIEQITEADAVVFGAPTYMGDVSGVFKVFADATAGVFFTGAWKDKLAAGFTNSHSFAGDKGHALESLTILAAQHGMNWVNLGLAPPGVRRQGPRPGKPDHPGRPARHELGEPGPGPSRSQATRATPWKA